VIPAFYGDVRRQFVAAVLLLMILSGGGLAAATLTLKNGDIVVGRVTSQSDSVVTVRTTDSTLMIGQDEIAAIESSALASTHASVEPDSEFQRGYQRGFEKGRFDAEDAIALQARRMRQMGACISVALEITLVVVLVLLAQHR
jgi:hypothetical protein